MKQGFVLLKTTRPLNIGGIPQHQHGVRILQEGTDVQDTFELQARVSLVDADLVHKDPVARSVENENEKGSHHTKANTPWPENICSIRFDQRLAVIARQDVEAAQDDHDERKDASHCYGRKTVFQHEQHEDLVPSRAMPAVRNKLRYPFGGLAEVVSFLEVLASQGSPEAA